MQLGYVGVNAPKRLLLRPRPYCNESWYGYLVRVTDNNYLDSPKALYAIFKSREELQEGLLLSQKEINRLQGPIPEIYQEFDTQVENSIYVFNLTYLRWCPRCIETKNYHQVFWILKFGCVCIQHRLRLQEQCPECQEFQSLMRNQLFRCQHCGAALKQAKHIKVDDDTVNLQETIYNAYLGIPSESQFNLTCRELSKLVLYLGQFSSADTPSKPGKFVGIGKLIYTFPLLKTTASLLNHWPMLIQDLLRGIQAQSTVTLSIKTHFKSLYRVIYQQLKEQSYQFLRDAFEDYLLQHWPSLINQRNKAFSAVTKKAQTRFTFKQMAARTGVEPAVVHHLIATEKLNCETVHLSSGRKFRLVHIKNSKYLREIAQHAITLQTVATRLQISEDRVRELIEAEMLTLLVSRVKQQSSKWLIHDSSLEKFSFDTLKWNGESVSFKQILKNWKLNQDGFIALVKALCIYKMRTFSEQGGDVFLGNVWLDKVTTKAWLTSYRTATRNTVSVDEAAKRLGVKQQVAYHLVKARLLVSYKDSYGDTRVHTDAITTFENNYVSLLARAKEMGTSPKYAHKLIAEIPVCGPRIDGSRQYFYLREKLND